MPIPTLTTEDFPLHQVTAGGGIEHDPQPGLPAWRCWCGGASGTDYARIRNDKLSIPQGEELWVGCDLYLPADFYEKSDAYKRFITLDNWGVAQSQACRLGLHVYSSDQWYVLRGEANNDVKPELLKLGMLVPDGATYRIEMHVKLSAGADGFVELYVDGERRARYDGTTFKPASAAQAKMTAAGFGIDGAAQQTRTVEVRVDNLYLGNARPGGTGPAPTPPPAQDDRAELEKDRADFEYVYGQLEAIKRPSALAKSARARAKTALARLTDYLA